MKKIRIALLFGGQSAEHEVSINSARNVYHALDKKKYEVTLIGIDQKGKWHFSLPQTFLNQSSKNTVIPNSFRDLVPSDTKHEFLLASFIQQDNPENHTIDVVFPVLHGPFGEDGTIQGMLKLMNLPFVGASVLGSAVGMDKDVMKRLLRDANIPIAKFIVVHKPVILERNQVRLGETIESPKKKILSSSFARFQDDQIPNFDVVVRQLGLPLFIKPANLGSSVGVSKVTTKEEFEKALEKAFQFDRKVIIEEAIMGREIEMSVLGNEDPIASVAGEIKTKGHDFYDYDAKYIDEDGAEIIIPAEVTKRELDDLQFMAIKTFKTLCCEGMARVDFFLTTDGKVYVNEINTIPGFTNISMYPKLWEASGISYSELVDRLITLAIERFKKDAALQSTRY